MGGRQLTVGCMVREVIYDDFPPARRIPQKVTFDDFMHWSDAEFLFLFWAQFVGRVKL